LAPGIAAIIAEQRAPPSVQHALGTCHYDFRKRHKCGNSASSRIFADRKKISEIITKTKHFLSCAPVFLMGCVMAVMASVVCLISASKLLEQTAQASDA
jgi:hypothetical protein